LDGGTSGHRTVGVGRADHRHRVFRLQVVEGQDGLVLLALIVAGQEFDGASQYATVLVDLFHRQFDSEFVVAAQSRVVTGQWGDVADDDRVVGITSPTSWAAPGADANGEEDKKGEEASHGWCACEKGG